MSNPRGGGVTHDVNNVRPVSPLPLFCIKLLEGVSLSHINAIHSSAVCDTKGQSSGTT